MIKAIKIMLIGTLGLTVGAKIGAFYHPMFEHDGTKVHHSCQAKAYGEGSEITAMHTRGSRAYVGMMSYEQSGRKLGDIQGLVGRYHVQAGLLSDDGRSAFERVGDRFHLRLPTKQTQQAMDHLWLKSGQTWVKVAYTHQGLQGLERLGDAYTPEDLVQVATLLGVSVPNVPDDIKTDRRRLVAWLSAQGTQSTDLARMGAVVQVWADDEWLVVVDIRGVVRLYSLTDGHMTAYVPVLSSSLKPLGQWQVVSVSLKGRHRKMLVGGLGSHRQGLMAIDISNPNQPSLAYDIEGSSLFEHMGHVYSAVSPTHFLINNNKEPVLMMGGGSDGCHARQQGFCGSSLRRGNAIYAIHALTGQRLMVWDSAQGVGDDRHMRYGFYGPISVLDINRDGVADHAYAADLGGQIFRLSLSNKTASTTAKGDVIRVFDANHDITDPKQRVSFMQSPIISMYHAHRHGIVGYSAKVALINIASSAMIDGVPTSANRVYGIFDGGLTNPTMRQLITPQQLTKLDGSVRLATLAGIRQSSGWYHKLSADGDPAFAWGQSALMTANRHLQAQGISAIYQVNKATTNPTCPHVRLNSQALRYCLPLGLCVHQQTGRLLAGQAVAKMSSVAGVWGNALGMTSATDHRLNDQNGRYRRVDLVAVPSDAGRSSGDAGRDDEAGMGAIDDGLLGDESQNNHQNTADVPWYEQAGQVWAWSLRPTRWYNIQSVRD